jgi:hypothetical protein
MKYLLALVLFMLVLITAGCTNEKLGVTSPTKENPNAPVITLTNLAIPAFQKNSIVGTWIGVVRSNNNITNASSQIDPSLIVSSSLTANLTRCNQGRWSACSFEYYELQYQEPGYYTWSSKNGDSGNMRMNDTDHMTFDIKSLGGQSNPLYGVSPIYSFVRKK